ARPLPSVRRVAASVSKALRKGVDFTRERKHMTSATAERRNGLANRTLREYYSRVFAYLAGAATLAAGTYTQLFLIDLLWMVPYALLYPQLAYHLGYRF